MLRALGLVFLSLLTLAAAWGFVLLLALAWVGKLVSDAFKGRRR